MKKEQPSVSQWFDERAENLKDDLIVRGTYGQWDKRLLAKDLATIHSLLNLKKTDSFLDIGCGNGLFLQAYAPLVKMAVGIDLSRKMLGRISLPVACSNLFSAQADARALPFKAGSFDAILCNWMLHYLRLEEVNPFLGEIRRITRPGARIFLGEIPLRVSLRGYEARAGRFLLRKLRIRASDRHLSPVETTRFDPASIENLAARAGFQVLSKGVMRHVLPSFFLPGFGCLVPAKVQHIFSKYDYRKSLPLIGASYFFLLGKTEEYADQ